MNCAAVTIDTGTGSPPAMPFSQRPDFAVANLGGPTCHTTPNLEPVYPNPGPDADVTRNLTKPETTPGIKPGCPGVNGIGEHGGNSAGPAPAAGGPYPLNNASSLVQETTSKANAPSSTATDLTYFQTGQQDHSQVSSTSAAAINSSSVSSTPAPPTSSAGPSKASSISTASAQYSVTSSTPTTLATSCVLSTAPSAPEYPSASGYVVTITSVYTTALAVTPQADSTSEGVPAGATVSPASSAGATISDNQSNNYAVPTSQAADYPGTYSASISLQSADSSSVTAYAQTISESPVVSSAPSYTDSPVSSAPTASDTSPPATTDTPAPSAGTSNSGAGSITTDGQCGAAAGGATCKDSTVFGACCSQFGWCGVTMTDQ